MPKMFDRTTFFAYVRKAPFGNRLTQEQINGMEVILDEWESKHSYRDLRWLAYILATAFHETGGRMVSVREGFAKTDAGARKIVAARKYGKPNADTGHVYYGRGLVQLTWFENYRRMGDILNLPLAEDPDIALEPEVSVAILFEGMMDGRSSRADFTNKGLEDYFNETTDDPVGARAIINGKDKQHLIAGYHQSFLDSLKAAEQALDEPVAPEKVESATPDGANLLADKTIWGTLATGAGGVAASLVGAINNPWALIAFAVVAAGVYLAVTGRIEIKRKAGA